jgi:hypothetical protein
MTEAQSAYYEARNKLYFDGAFAFVIDLLILWKLASAVF